MYCVCIDVCGLVAVDFRVYCVCVCYDCKHGCLVCAGIFRTCQRCSREFLSPVEMEFCVCQFRRHDSSHCGYVCAQIVL